MNRSSKTVLSAMALAAASGAAMAQAPGDVVFTSISGNSVNMVTPAGVTSLLHTFSNADVRPAGITLAGDGNWYVNSGPIPIQDPSTASVYKITDLFGTPGESVFASSDPIQAPVGLAWDRRLGVLVSVNDPGPVIAQPRMSGILTHDINVAGDTFQTYFQPTPPVDPVPHYRNGNRLVKDPSTDDYFVVCINGSTFDGVGPDADGSTIQRLSIDNSRVGTVQTLVDLGDTGVTGLADPITFARGITFAKGSIYVLDRGADLGQGAIYRVDLDGGGNFAGITQIFQGQGQLGNLIYNRYTNLIMFSDNFTDSLTTMKLDGSDVQILAPMADARDFYVIPTPSTLALVGMGGLVAMRRRR